MEKKYIHFLGMNFLHAGDLFMGELPDVEDTTSEYVAILKETSKTVKRLLEDLEAASAALIEERARTKELQAKLELYYETGISNISRNTFRHYVRAVLERDETEVEWRHFLLTFTHDNTRLNNKIYKWIETCIVPFVKKEPLQG